MAYAFLCWWLNQPIWTTWVNCFIISPGNSRGDFIKKTWMKPPARHFAVFKLPFLWLQVESESRRVTRWESAAHGCHTGIELVCWMPYHVRWNSQSYRYYVLHMILEVCMLQNSTRFGMDQKMVANHFKAFSFMGGSRSPRWLVDDPQKSALAIQVNQKKATNGQWNLEEMPWALPKHCNRGLLDLID